MIMEKALWPTDSWKYAMRGSREMEDQLLDKMDLEGAGNND